MRLTFTDTVPEEERRWLGRLIRRCGNLWDFADWEVRVNTKRFRGHDLAEVFPHFTAHQLEVWLNPKRFAERQNMRADLLHELWHKVTSEVEAVFDDLAAFIPDEKKRRRAVRRAHRRYEIWHDKTSLLWNKVLR